MQSSVVIGLGWGDEGKGLVTDWLCSKSPNPIVVRFSGGQQAGHTVMIDGKKHIHSNYGAGTLRGVPSFFSEYCSIYLITLAKEKELLEAKGVKPELYVDEHTMVTTPYDVAYNRYTERINNHGSCGLGVGATMKRNKETGYKLCASDLAHPKIAVPKLEAIRHYYHNLIREKGLNETVYAAEYEQMDEEFKCLMMRQANEEFFKLATQDVLKTYDSVIAEGSQGIMLDMDYGIFPHVTYGKTTSSRGKHILARTAFMTKPSVYYVTRCYQTRHGNGWMSNETPLNLINTEEEINKTNPWQGKFRTGEIDYDILNYALSCDNDNNHALFRHSSHLVVTCLDQRPGFNFEYKKLKTKFDSISGCFSPLSTGIVELSGKLSPV